MKEQPTTDQLCKHDWVGDDNCAYCRAEAALGLLTEARHIIEEADPCEALDREEAGAWEDWKRDWLKSLEYFEDAKP